LSPNDNVMDDYCMIQLLKNIKFLVILNVALTFWKISIVSLSADKGLMEVKVVDERLVSLLIDCRLKLWIKNFFKYLRAYTIIVRFSHLYNKTIKLILVSPIFLFGILIYIISLGLNKTRQAKILFYLMFASS